MNCGRYKSKAEKVGDDWYCPNCGASSKTIFFEDDSIKKDEKEEDE